MSTQAEYLNQLGVDLWLPRKPLSAAASSPQWVYSFTHPTLAVGYTTDAPAAQPRAAVAPKIKGGHSLSEQHAEQRSIAHISEALAQEAEPASPAKESVVSTPQRLAPQLVPRFRFALTRTPRFLIIDELPTQGPQILSERYKKLLIGVVAALGETPDQMSLPVMLQWPHLAGSKLNQGADEAAKYVQLTVESLQKKSRAQHILLFGAGLSRWVLGEDHAETPTGELLLHPEKNSSCLVTLTLSQALQLPEIKRQIWSDLQPVVMP